MKTWIDRLLLLAMTLSIAGLTATSLPVLAGGHIEGLMLMAHMSASGVLVFTLPVFAILCLNRGINPALSNPLIRFGYWSLIFTGLLSILTMFLCMLPIPSTDQMHALVLVHRYAGFAMVPALLLLLAGVTQWRRIQSTRSATPG